MYQKVEKEDRANHRRPDTQHSWKIYNRWVKHGDWRDVNRVASGHQR